MTNRLHERLGLGLKWCKWATEADDSASGGRAAKLKGKKQSHTGASEGSRAERERKCWREVATAFVLSAL
jgi:hypothetical protein